MSAAEADAVTRVADQLFTAIENSDMATVGRLFSDDIAVWRTGARSDDDKERALRVLRWFIDVTADRRYEILDRQLFSGPVTGFVQQHILHASGHNGESIAMRVCIVIKLGVNTLISRIDEYFDPAGIAPLMS
ncbi:nuclear transport factor 2 family protein [Mycobacterium sp.]|uniref:nuclear transport factor 2 family protein n=1 Tax=Mycobacterium sp. TaxID=1785 RepID=UPI003D6C2467